jgi:5-formyltetrahydrofolate cyclo-ligase
MVGSAKEQLRAELLAARRALHPAQRAAAGLALRDHLLSLPEVASAAAVAAYVSVGTEPSTEPLCEALQGRNVRVLLPQLRPDLDLDWADYAGRGRLRYAPFGLREPAGASLGPAALALADVVIVPGLAVDRRGVRLGRGGGSYDRALLRVPPGRPVVVLLYDDEVLHGVPQEPHDRTVDMAVTPARILRLPEPTAATGAEQARPPAPAREPARPPPRRRQG